MAPHILLVDADPTVAQVTSAIVRRIAPDATLASANTPELGWHAVERQTPDILIIDPPAQPQAGLLMIRLCRAMYPGMRIVVLASTPSPTLRAATKEIGVSAYLEKPVAHARLVERLRAVIDPEPTPPALPSVNVA